MSRSPTEYKVAIGELTARLDAGKLYAAGRADQLLQGFDDQQVKRLIRIVQRLEDPDVSLDGRDEAEIAEYVHLQWTEPLLKEFIRRRDLSNHARAQLDANGHELEVACDDVRQDKSGDGWMVWCTCRDGTQPVAGRHPSEAAARAAAQPHLEAYGGAWEPEPRTWMEELAEWLDQD